MKNPRSQSEQRLAAPMANDLRHSASISEHGRTFSNRLTISKCSVVRPCVSVSGRGAIIRTLSRRPHEPDIQKSWPQPLLQILTVPGTVRIQLKHGVLYALVPCLCAHVMPEAARCAVSISRRTVVLLVSLPLGAVNFHLNSDLGFFSSPTAPSF